LYMLPEYQRQGIGRKLIQTGVRELRRSGVTNLLIFALSENPFRKFYEMLGGMPVRTITREIGGKLFKETGYGWEDSSLLLPVSEIPALATTHKLPNLVLAPSYCKGAYDSHAIDCPFPFYHNGLYYLLHIGWDGVGYQTGLANSPDLLNWHKEGVALPRGPKGSVTEFNAAITNLLRDNNLYGPGTLKKVNGRFVGTYHAYPNPGYEEGAAVVGLCFSDDLRHWEVSDPILRPEEGADWERGGLYKTWLMEHQGRYYLFYNAKNYTTGSWREQTGLALSDDLTHWQRYPGNPVIHTGSAGAHDEVFASDPCVLRWGNRWVMFYFGLSKDGHARDLAAISDDLKQWHKLDGALVDVGIPGSIDATHAHKAGIITRAGKLYHFYCAVSPSANLSQGEVSHSERRGITIAYQV
jgi:predicted GH43/DUF377 family glycosyl hydrolase